MHGLMCGGLNIEIQRLGWLDYRKAQQLQLQLVEQRKADQIVDQLLLLQHPPVITLGRKDSGRFLKASESELARLNIRVVRSGRGGEITFHGPGQLVAYPILKLREDERDLHLHLRRLEETVLLMLEEWGLEGERVKGRTGVWLGQQKVAAIGVRASAWVTSHGLALNVDGSLMGFDLMVPCGLEDAGVTRLADHLDPCPTLVEVEERFIHFFLRVFQRRADRHSGRQPRGESSFPKSS